MYVVELELHQRACFRVEEASTFTVWISNEYKSLSSRIDPIKSYIRITKQSFHCYGKTPFNLEEIMWGGKCSAAVSQ